VKDRTDLLFETFVKSNRLALIWAVPFGFGMLLFAPALVDFVLGDRWAPAVTLLQVLGLVVGLGQLGFNWSLFFQATGNTRPMAVSGFVALGVFGVATAPLMLAFGLDGYVVGMALNLCAQLSTRAIYLSRLFSSFDPWRHLVRSVTPVVPAIALVLLSRAVFGSPQSLGAAASEFAVYVLTVAIATLFAERRLLGEMLGYLRGRTGAPVSAVA
jgi:O-antigen/teichoic acid export membrane protein